MKNNSHKKQDLIIILAIAIAIAFTSCSTNKGNIPQLQASESQPSSPKYNLSVPIPEKVPVTRPWKIALVIKTDTDPYWQRIKKAGLISGENLGIDVEVVSSSNPQNAEYTEEQIKLLAQQLAENQLDGIIIGPADSIRLVPIITKAINQGIPVIVIDTPLDSELVLTYIGFDNWSAGKTMGEWVVNQLGGQGKILLLDGAKHHDNAIERHNGIVAGLKTGNIEILSTRSANWNRQEAKEITQQWLEQYPEIDAIVAANDEMALGAIEAISATNRQNVLVTGFDGSENGLKAIESGQLGATIDQIPEEQVKIALDLLIYHLETRKTLPTPILLQNLQLITR